IEDENCAGFDTNSDINSPSLGCIPEINSLVDEMLENNLLVDLNIFQSEESNSLEIENSDLNVLETDLNSANLDTNFSFDQNLSEDLNISTIDANSVQENLQEEIEVLKVNVNGRIVNCIGVACNLGTEVVK
ncbi:MAG: hypothetical protein Q7K42_05880, partial [Candidatus Diapherotrites archaeon]|nr:hypothetical protein [Candidatus Diapherotrites archaeon]